MNQIKNQVQLIGHVGLDPEIRSLDSGKRLATFSIATNEQYTNATGTKITNTSWHRIEVWGSLVDVVEKYLCKGKQVAIQGKLQNKQYEDKQGNKRMSTSVVAN
ncbi:UNVERIFIED_CONTAM: hypothetical protein GTU68_061869, partial [Idotea baltica]|nr:hypothetical protein [Idotea baltica]